jgi:hypothetical protein
MVSDNAYVEAGHRESENHRGGNRDPEAKQNSELSGGWAEDHERLKPCFFDIFACHPLITLVFVLLFGILVFGRILP